MKEMFINGKAGFAPVLTRYPFQIIWHLLIGTIWIYIIKIPYQKNDGWYNFRLHDRSRDSGSGKFLECSVLFVRALQIRPSKRRIPNTQMLCQFPQEVLSQPRIPVDS